MRDINAILSSRLLQSVKTRFTNQFTPVGPDECWEWTGLKNASGYGILSVCFDDETYYWGNEGAHRIAYLLTHGSVPFIEGHGIAHVLHRCDNPGCVNPKHLFPGTYGDNNRDKSAKGRAPRGTTHPHTKLNEEQIRRLKQDDRPYKVLEIAYGLSMSTISRIKTGASWAHVAGPAVIIPAYVRIRGANHPSTNLTENDVRAIRDDNRQYKQIADERGMSVSAIARIKNRKTWAYVS